jgi:hypothetical protein
VAGYREFVSGEVLTAVNVNTFLMEQSIMTFEDGTARDAALTDVLREGMVAYLEDVKLPTFYNGTAWTTEFGGGGLVAVKSALFTGTQTASVTAGSNVAVTNLSITHTLADAANKLIISAYFGAAASSTGRGTVGLAVADDGTLIGIGDAEGDRTRVGAGGRVDDGGQAEVVNMPSVMFVYEPGDAASHTYTVRAINIRVETQTVYINRSEDDSDSASRPRSSSGLVIQEVKV